MKIILHLIVYYLAAGLVFMWFYVLLARRPTLSGVLFEFFCWPHRVWIGAKMMWANVGRVYL